jgi:hypothetical protein
LTISPVAGPTGLPPELEASFLHISYETRSSRAGKRVYQPERAIIATDYTLGRCTANPVSPAEVLSGQQPVLGKHTTIYRKHA